MSDYINGYALALFNLAKEEKKLIKYKNQAIEIIEALEANPKAIHVFNSKVTDIEERKALVKKAFGKLDKTLINFLYVLTERSKFNLTVSILRKLIKLINENKNINEGVVYSINKLSPKQIKDIEVKTSKMLGAKVVLTNKLDANLIGGIKVEVNNEIIEDTVVSRLEQIKQQLLNEREEN